jgi:hypothetical protein
VVAFPRKLLEMERVSHHCVLTQEALDSLQRPTVETGQRVSALRFGDPRVMALFQALCAFTQPVATRRRRSRSTTKTSEPSARIGVGFELTILALIPRFGNVAWHAASVLR